MEMQGIYSIRNLILFVRGNSVCAKIKGAVVKTEWVIMNQVKKPIVLFIFSIIVVSGLSSFLTASARVNVVFDIGGVFMHRNEIAISRHTGFQGLAYLLLKRKNPGTLLFNVLNAIILPGELTDEDRQSCDHRGRPLPNGLLHWLKGNASGREILKAIERYYDEEAKCGSTEKRVMKRMLQVVFDPDMYAKTTTIYPQAFDFLHKCIDQGDHVYILSNYDSGSFEAMQEMLPGFFDLFDGVVISAEVKLMKPNPKIFSHLLDTYQLNPEETVFIDDQHENLDAAAKMGIFPIRCRTTGRVFKSPDFNEISEIFAQWIDERDTQADVCCCGLNLCAKSVCITG